MKWKKKKQQVDRLDGMEWMSKWMVGWMCTQTHKHPTSTSARK